MYVQFHSITWFIFKFGISENLSDCWLCRTDYCQMPVPPITKLLTQSFISSQILFA